MAKGVDEVWCFKISNDSGGGKGGSDTGASPLNRCPCADKGVSGSRLGYSALWIGSKMSVYERHYLSYRLRRSRRPPGVCLAATITGPITRWLPGPDTHRAQNTPRREDGASGEAGQGGGAGKRLLLLTAGANCPALNRYWEGFRRQSSHVLNCVEYNPRTLLISSTMRCKRE
jgi:hypothetical protein